MDEQGAKNMTTEAFRIALDWNYALGGTDFRLIGGEPTLAPNFIKFMEIAANDARFQNIMIFSNFTFDEHIANNIIRISHEKNVYTLPNINEFDLLFPKQRENILRNIDLFSQQLSNFETLGINIYRPDLDLTQWKELFLKYKNLTNFRYSIAVPTEKILRNEFDFYEYYHSFENILVELARFCAENGIRMGNDCNNLPICCFSPEAIVEIMKGGSWSAFGFEDYCGYPIIDVLPDLTVAGCFGLNRPGTFNLKLTDFNTPQELTSYLDACGDRYDKLARKECLDCIRYIKTGISCSCRSGHLIDKKEAINEKMNIAR